MKDAEHRYRHFFELAERRPIRAGDVALCGYVAPGPERPHLDDKHDCPECLAAGATP